MPALGSQTSRYNRLVTIFVALGSFVSQITASSIETPEADKFRFARPMDTARPSSGAQSGSQDGICTSTCLSKGSLGTPRRRLMPSRLQMGCTALEGQWELCP